MTRQEHALLKQAGQSAPRFAVHAWQKALTQIDAADWDSLAVKASSPNPFYERWALTPALAQFAREHPVMLGTFYVGGTLVGLVPLSVSRKYYDRPIPHISVWLHQNAFCGTPLIAGGYEIAFWSALLEWADTAATTPLFFHFAKQPTENPVYQALREVASLQRRALSCVQQEQRAMLASKKSPEDYFNGSMSTKKRKELRRQHKRLGEEAVLEFSRSRNANGVDAWIDAFLWLEKSGWKGQQGTSLADNTATSTFFRQTLEGAAHAGRLERLTMSLDGRPIAMLANFLTAPGAYSFKTTFDETYARFSPGVLLQRENLALLDCDDIDWADSCAAADHPMIDRIWREKREILSLNVSLGGPARRMAMQLLAKLETGTFPKGP